MRKFYKKKKKKYDVENILNKKKKSKDLIYVRSKFHISYRSRRR